MLNCEAGMTLGSRWHGMTNVNIERCTCTIGSLELFGGRAEHSYIEGCSAIHLCCSYCVWIKKNSIDGYNGLCKNILL